MIIVLQVCFLIFPFLTKPLAPLVCFGFIASGVPVYLVLVWPEHPPQWAKNLDMKVRCTASKHSAVLKAY